MGSPGFLTDAELAPVNGIVLGGDGRMARNAAARMNRAIANLERESGIRIVFSDWGLYRTAAIQIGIGGTSVNNSAHTQGVGADINNQRAYRNWNEARFVQIMAEEGFIFDVDYEPWHVRGVNTAPAGGSTSPFPNDASESESSMDILPNSDGKWYAQGDIAVVVETGPDLFALQQVEKYLAAHRARVASDDPARPQMADEHYDVWVRYSAKTHPTGSGGATPIDYDALAVAIAEKFTIPPLSQAEREAIAAEVIRQQKLAGN